MTVIPLICPNCGHEIRTEDPSGVSPPTIERLDVPTASVVRARAIRDTIERGDVTALHSLLNWGYKYVSIIRDLSTGKVAIGRIAFSDKGPDDAEEGWIQDIKFLYASGEDRVAPRLSKDYHKDNYQPLMVWFEKEWPSKPS